MSKDNTSIGTGICQIIIWVVLFILIVLRIIDDALVPANSIWIINYIGMGIAFLNLFIEKANKLSKKRHEKFRPFVGLTIILAIIICVLGIGVGKLQSAEIGQRLNDVITLLAVVFSLSKNVWNAILDVIIRFLK